MLIDAHMGEGGVKNCSNHAHVVYGWSLIHILNRFLQELETMPGEQKTSNFFMSKGEFCGLCKISLTDLPSGGSMKKCTDCKVANYCSKVW